MTEAGEPQKPDTTLDRFPAEIVVKFVAIKVAEVEVVPGEEFGNPAPKLLTSIPAERCRGINNEARTSVPLSIAAF